MKKHICRFMAAILTASCLFTSVPISADPVTTYTGSAEEVLATSSNAKEIYHFLVYNMGLNSAARFSGLLEKGTSKVSHQ